LKTKKIPQRKCVGCDQLKDKKELIRVVRTPEGEITIDVTGKKAGRGAYVCPDKECITKAFKAHRFDRAFEKQIGDDLLKKIMEQLNDK